MHRHRSIRLSGLAISVLNNTVHATVAYAHWAPLPSVLGDIAQSRAPPLVCVGGRGGGHTGRL